MTGKRFIFPLAGVIAAVLAIAVVFQPKVRAAEMAAGSAATTAAGMDKNAQQRMRAPANILLTPGQIRAFPVSEVSRVAVGNPLVADVTIVSSSEILIQAKSMGSTNMLLWETDGQRTLTITVVDARPATIAQEITKLLDSEQFKRVRIETQTDRVFLLGTVDADPDLQVLTDLAGSFPNNLVVNLATVKPQVDPLVPMVQLSVRVVEVSRGDLERLGVSWNQSMSFVEDELPFASVKDTLVRVGQSITRDSLNTTLNALVTQNKARLLSEPKLVTASGKEASSFIGFDVPVLETASIGNSTGTVNVSIEFKKTGVLLKMTPNVKTVENKQKITTILDAEVSSIDTSVGLSVPVGANTILVPGFKVRKANTEVTTTSGDTIVIAGLLELDQSDTTSGVPGLSKIPVLGRLFKDPEIETSQRELVITVTPDVLDQKRQDMEEIYSNALAQAKQVTQVAPSIKDPKLEYAMKVQEKIAKAIQYPLREKSLNVQGAIRLRLHLLPDGTLDRILIAESSGLDSLDTEALKTAQTQAPYPPFPKEVGEKELWLEVPIVFQP